MSAQGIGIRKAPACDEECDVCEASLKKGKHVEVETAGYILKFCNKCAGDIGGCVT